MESFLSVPSKKQTAPCGMHQPRGGWLCCEAFIAVGFTCLQDTQNDREDRSPTGSDQPRATPTSQPLSELQTQGQKMNVGGGKKRAFFNTKNQTPPNHSKIQKSKKTNKPKPATNKKSNNNNKIQQQQQKRWVASTFIIKVP